MTNQIYFTQITDPLLKIKSLQNLTIGTSFEMFHVRDENRDSLLQFLARNKKLVNSIPDVRFTLKCKHNTDEMEKLAKMLELYRVKGYFVISSDDKKALHLCKKTTNALKN